MKQFIRFVVASAVGTILGLFGLFFLSMMIMAGLAMTQANLEDRLGPIGDPAILYLPMDGILKDRVSQTDFLRQFNPYGADHEIGLYELSETLKAAAQDSKVKGLYLEFKSFQSGLANAEALRREIVRFKESGKFVVAYSEVYTELAYLVASAADDVILYPRGYFEWDGLHSTVRFFQGTLKKLEVVPQVFRVGKYKSAIEPFITDKMSEASREQLDAILTNAWEQIRGYASEKTNLSSEDLENIADKAEVVTAQQALERGFVGQLATADQVESKLKELVGAKDKAPLSHWHSYKKQFLDSRSQNSKAKIAVVFNEGGITTAPDNDGGISSEELTEVLDKIRRDETIKAVVLRVNSPGGSALASDVIWASTQLLKEAKPLVTSFGNVAASGGYYMSAGSQFIFAEPTTITGSIGVFGLSFATEDFWNNKIGMTFDTVKSHRFADLESLAREMDPTERMKMQVVVDQIYEDFLAVVVSGRDALKNRDDAHKIAQGRVWTGVHAKEIGLVDEIGGLESAVAKAAELAGLKDFSVETYPKEKSPLEQIVAQMGDVSLHMIQAIIPESLWSATRLLRSQEKIQEKVQARLPYELELLN